ncbi:type II toxin-antitoxin system Phd/YefM family antitoxin [Streptomyces galilaeus]
MTAISITAAQAQLGHLVRLVAHNRESIALTDRGHVVALLVSPHVMEDLEDDLAIADYRRRRAEGTLEEGIPHEEVRRILGLRSSPTASSGNRAPVSLPPPGTPAGSPPDRPSRTAGAPAAPRPT